MDETVQFALALATVAGFIFCAVMLLCKTLNREIVAMMGGIVGNCYRHLLYCVGLTPKYYNPASYQVEAISAFWGAMALMFGLLSSAIFHFGLLVAFLWSTYTLAGLN